MTTDAIIAGVLAREQGFVNRADDRGGPTNYGITAATLGAWRKFGRPATAGEVYDISVDEAKAILSAQYVAPFALVTNDAIQTQLVDFGVTSGVETAINALQRVCGVPVDGHLGPETRSVLCALPWRLVNDALIAQRMHLDVAIVNHNAAQSINLLGWSRRAVSFLASL